MKKIILTSFVVGMALSASAVQIDYSYNKTGADNRTFGYERAETYDVAILVDEPSLKGTTLTGLSVSIPGAENISEVSGWLTSELKLVRKNGKQVNEPDILTCTGTITNGVLSVTFDQPYVIESAFYAGYSFIVDKAEGGAENPVSIAGKASKGGLYIHSTRSCLKWADCTGSAKGVSDMKLLIEGDFSNNAASVSYGTPLTGSTESETVELELLLANHGLNSLQSVDYTWSLGSKSGQGTFVPETSLPTTVWGVSCPLVIDAGHFENNGEYELTVTVDKVNGQPNTDKCSSVTMPVRIFDFTPVMRPLIEEYTGLWCAFCPKGYVAMETMKEEYPDRFIGIAYHDRDDMDADEMKPHSPGSYPAMYIERGRSEMPISEIYTIWPEAASKVAPAAVDVQVNWADESKSELEVKAEVRFIYDYSNVHYGISCVLVADGLSDPDWEQSNAYAGKTGDPDVPGKWGELFTNGPKGITGLVFNDVALGIKDLKGDHESIPTDIIAGEKYVYSTSFILDELGAVADLAKKYKDNLRAVAVLVDRDNTGKALNCNTSLPIGKSTGIYATGVRTEVVSTRWYDLQGRPLMAPTTGLNIRLDILSDGSHRVSKVMTR